MCLLEGPKCTEKGLNEIALHHIWNIRNLVLYQTISSFFIRQETGFQVLKDPASSRSVFIRKADSSDAIIHVSQPSDCLLLQTDHIKYCVRTLSVWFDYRFIDSVNGPSERQSPDMWEEALNHLLRTFRPSWCFLHNGCQYTGIPEGHRLRFEDGTAYEAYWNKAHTCLNTIE